MRPPKVPSVAFKRGQPDDWPLERIAKLSVAEIKQLRANAERLDEPELVELCSHALRIVPPRARAGAPAAKGVKPRATPKPRIAASGEPG